MRLSDAIRRGAKMRPQNIGSFFSEKGSGSTCALGAAAEGCGVLGACLNSSSLYPLNNRWPMMYDSHHESPCGCIPTGWMLHNQIAHLNDIHKWSREAIAEWVETIENKQEPHPPRAEGDLAPPGNAAGDAASVSAPAGPVSLVQV